MATSRCSRGSRARHTSPIPPAPRGATNSYGPIFAPGSTRLRRKPIMARLLGTLANDGRGKNIADAEPLRRSCDRRDHLARLMCVAAEDDADENRGQTEKGEQIARGRVIEKVPTKRRRLCLNEPPGDEYDHRHRRRHRHSLARSLRDPYRSPRLQG